MSSLFPWWTLSTKAGYESTSWITPEMRPATVRRAETLPRKSVVQSAAGRK
ncbi:hypothetical protein [Kribbella sp. NPDC000426]|uniref:hypothetical protein n=1 Tax=Kribbella sp. NPDC000426 TaxID=3154255 RepID=UPI00331CDA9C